MKTGFLALAILLASFIGAQAFAQDSDIGGSAPIEEPAVVGSAKIVKFSASLTGTAVLTSTGPCSSSFGNQCPNGHSCSCYTLMGGKLTSGRLGKGSANMFATVDRTLAFGQIGGACVPFNAEIDIIAKKDSPNFDVVGGACFDAQGNLASNGAMGLASSLVYLRNGYATYTATINGKSGKTVVRFNGALQ
jgi:hypothetical protein